MPLTKLTLGVGLLAAVVLAVSACGSGNQVVSPPTTSADVTSHGAMLGGTVQCTATLPASVPAGHDLGAVFTFHNVSKRTAKVDLAYGGLWVLVKSPGGTAYDSRVPLENERGPYVPPTPLAPGATKTVSMPPLRVRWGGPLHVTPGCGLSTLRPVTVAVTSPGLPQNEKTAVNDVVAASGHLLDHCRPTTPGVSVVGHIDPPTGTAPPMQARCSVTLRRERGFYVAQELVVTPPDLRGVHIEEPYGTFTRPTPPNENAEAIAWQFVVTRDGATSVSTTDEDSTVSADRMAPDWTWTGSKWQGPGSSQCGGGGGGEGIDGPYVSFVSACGR